MNSVQIGQKSYEMPPRDGITERLPHELVVAAPERVQVSTIDNAGRLIHYSDQFTRLVSTFSERH